MTGPPTPDNQPPGNAQQRYTSGAGHPGDDPLKAQRAKPVGFWALVRHRFRAHAQRSSVSANRDCQQEDR